MIEVISFWGLEGYFAPEGFPRCVWSQATFVLASWFLLQLLHTGKNICERLVVARLVVAQRETCRPKNSSSLSNFFPSEVCPPVLWFLSSQLSKNPRLSLKSSSCVLAEKLSSQWTGHVYLIYLRLLFWAVLYPMDEKHCIFYTLLSLFNVKS